MIYPRVKFRISQVAELRTLKAFFHDVKYDNGRSLKWAIFRRHRELKNIIKNSSKLPLSQIIKYIRDVYKQNNVHFLHDTIIVEKQWRKKEMPFFLLTKNLFPNLTWPKGKYIAYFTIWSMFPRFLDDKTFQIPFFHKKKGYINVIIAHELLHFIFYKYFYKWYPQYRNPKYNYFVWNISEIFNILIQNSKPWIKEFNQKALLYPEHKNILSVLKNKLNKKTFIAKELTKYIVDEFKKRKWQ